MALGTQSCPLSPLVGARLLSFAISEVNANSWTVDKSSLKLPVFLACSLLLTLILAPHAGRGHVVPWWHPDSCSPHFDNDEKQTLSPMPPYHYHRHSLASWACSPLIIPPSCCCCRKIDSEHSHTQTLRKHWGLSRAPKQTTLLSATIIALVMKKGKDLDFLTIVANPQLCSSFMT